MHENEWNKDKCKTENKIEEGGQIYVTCTCYSPGAIAVGVVVSQNADGTPKNIIPVTTFNPVSKIHVEFK